MTSFEKYQASAEARRGSHGDHVGKLTGYFLAETNRLREQQPAPEPQDAPASVHEPAPRPRGRFGQLLWWRHR
ncbi:MAG: hypothetical protein ABW224_06640 [Kibdelosporangium sp.]